LAVVVALVSTIGFGWTVLALLGASIAGFVLAGSQVKRHIRRLRSGITTPQGAVTDSALVALGTVLVFIPGLVTTAARRMPLITVAATGAGRRGPGRGDYIEGEVIDVVDSDVDGDIVDVVDIEP